MYGLRTFIIHISDILMQGNVTSLISRKHGNTTGYHFYICTTCMENYT